MRFSISASSLQQLAAALFLLALLRRARFALRVGRRQQRQLAPHLRQQLLLLLLQLLDLAPRLFGASPSSTMADGGSGDGGAALVGLAAAGQVGLRDGLRLGRPLVGARVDQDHLERRVLEHAVETLAGRRSAPSAAPPCTPTDTSSAHCRVVSFAASFIGLLSCRGRVAASAGGSASASTSMASVQPASGAAASSSSALGRSRPSLGRCRHPGAPAALRARRASAGRCRSARTRTRVPRGRLSQPTALNTSGSVSARTRPSFITVASSSRTPLLLAASAASSSARWPAGSRCRRRRRRRTPR